MSDIMGETILIWVVFGFIYGFLYFAFTRKKFRPWLILVVTLLGPLAPAAFLVIFIVFIVKTVALARHERRLKTISHSEDPGATGKLDTVDLRKIRVARNRQAVIIPVVTAVVISAIVLISAAVSHQSPFSLIRNLMISLRDGLMRMVL